MTTTSCSFEGCKNDPKVKGYCYGHDKQLQRAGGDVAALRPLRGPHGKMNYERISTRTTKDTAEKLREIGRRRGATDPDRALYLGAQVVLEEHVGCVALKEAPDSSTAGAVKRDSRGRKAARDAAGKTKGKGRLSA